MNAEPTSPRPRSRGAREKLVAAAKEVLIRDGDKALSVSEVARIAGINRATAYKYFASRDELAQAAVGEIALTMRDFVKLSGDVDVGNFAATSRALQLFIMNNRESCRAWAIEALLSGRGRDDPLSQQFLDLQASLGGRDYMQDGIDAEVMAIISLAATFIWPLWNDTDGCDDATRQQLAERLTRELTRFALFGAMKADHFPSLVDYVRGGKGKPATPAKGGSGRRKAGKKA